MLTFALNAQSEVSSIVSFVKDPTGGVVPRSKVILKNEGAGAEHLVEANGPGYYVASQFGEVNL